MKIYTRTGDNGTTGLFGEQQVSKDALRVEAYGKIDELNAQLGLVLLAIEGGQWRERIVQVQNDLLVLGADLATPLGETTAPAWVPRIAEADVSRLESWIGQAEGELMPNRLSDFLFVWARLVNQRLGVAGLPWLAHGAPAGGSDMLMLEKPLRFAPAEASIDIPSEVQSALLEQRNTPTLLDWAASSARRLNTLPCGVVFRIGKLRLPEERSRALAHAIIYAICAALRRLGTPESIEVEIDRPQQTRVMPNQQSRTLLPHHDGGHCSYLTPSQFDDPTWQPALRRFSSENFTTTQAHKLYQGIFIADPGEGLSVTTYFNWVEVVRRAYTRATGQGDAAVAQVAAWLGANIRASLQLQPQHKSKYLSLTAALGARALVQHGLAVHYAEADFTPEEVERFPELRRLREQAAQVGRSPTEFFLSQGLIETLGLSWVDFRATYQLCVPSERFDLLLGHNLTLVHGGLMGGPGRLIEPICLVMDQPNGEDYERWLAKAWRSQTAPA